MKSASYLCHGERERERLRAFVCRPGLAWPGLARRGLDTRCELQPQDAEQLPRQKVALIRPVKSGAHGDGVPRLGLIGPGSD